MAQTSLFPETAPGLCHLPGFAVAQERALYDAILRLAAASPFRHMSTPGGQTIAAAMTNCGNLGWVSDRQGYRYSTSDPMSNAPWPAMPEAFLALAQDAATRAGYAFSPDACLVNRYAPGAKMGLHRDADEQDFTAPIVSVSLGLPITFLWGGATKREKNFKIPLFSGDVLVWGGTARRYFHGVGTLAKATHPVCGGYRYNLTFRKAGA